MTSRTKTHVFSPILAFSLAALVPGGTSSGQEPASVSELEKELRETEVAFAATMAARDLDAFTGFLSEEVIFFTGDNRLRGREAVSEAWAPYFEGEAAPFSWEPEAVAVLGSGDLGFSSGPVFDPEGKRIGTFNSVWRRLPDGSWRIIFDRGCPSCDRS